ncbi:hypothetical protein Q9233_002348 [Columba guinea]|nr:hypothetical protein Q9233_002348 [Columba guinea]
MNNKFDALKDDDSGDHDQNEENNTQKDSEKEKNDREKPQSTTKRKAVVPGPAEHPLQYNYTFWYSRRTPGRPTSSQSYEQNIKQIGTFASVSISLLSLCPLGTMWPSWLAYPCALAVRNRGD